MSMLRELWQKQEMRPFLFLFLAFLLLFQIAFFIAGLERSLHGDGDFPAFYRAACLLRSGHRFELYDPATQDNFDHVVLGRQMDGLYFYHPAFEVPFLLPLAFLPYRVAFWCWTAIGLGFLFLSSRVLKQPFVLLLTFFPVVVALLQGQDSLILLFVLSLAYHRFQLRQDWSCGILLALGLFKFQHVIPLACILGWRRPKVLLGFAAIGTGILLFSWAIVGTAGALAYWNLLWHHGSEQVWRMVNIRGLAEPAGVPGSIVIAISLAVLSWAAWRGLNFPMALVITQLVSHHLFMSDLVLLLVPIAFILEHRSAKARTLLLAVLFFAPLYVFLLTHELTFLLVLPMLGLILVREEDHDSHVAARCTADALSGRDIRCSCRY